VMRYIDGRPFGLMVGSTFHWINAISINVSQRLIESLEIE